MRMFKGFVVLSRLSIELRKELKRIYEMFDNKRYAVVPFVENNKDDEDDSNNQVETIGVYSMSNGFLVYKIELGNYKFFDESKMLKEIEKKHMEN